MKRLATLPLHPLFFALTPVFFLYGYNARRMLVPGSEILLPLLVALAGTVVLWLLLGLTMRNAGRSALLVSAALLLFSLYGHLLRILPGRVATAKPLILFLGWLLLLAVVLYAVTGLFHLAPAIHVPLNAVGLLALAVNLAIAVPPLLRNSPKTAPKPAPIAPARPDLPDIYFIVLDAYARSDKLASIYGTDNSGFIRFLRESGFYVADSAQSNYPQTYQSLGATLNLTYLDSLAAEVGPESDDRTRLGAMLLNNRVMEFLRRQGYRINAFASGYQGTEMLGVDRYIKPPAALGNFHQLLLNTTAAAPIAALFTRNSPFEPHRRRVRFIFQQLPDVAAAPGPDFVFAHIVSPHPPFIFGARGEPVEPEVNVEFSDGNHLHHTDRHAIETYTERYPHQLEYISRLAENTIRRILRRAKHPPVIVLLADHGPGARLHWDEPDFTDFSERLSILYACYLPDRDYREFRPAMTPVNTFRVIFNRYFGTDYTLLPNKSYFSAWGTPYRFLDIAEYVQRPRTIPDSVTMVVFRVGDNPPPNAGIYLKELVEKTYPGTRIAQSFFTPVKEQLSVADAFARYRAAVDRGEIPEMGKRYEYFRGEGPDWNRVTALYFPDTTNLRPAGRSRRGILAHRDTLPGH